MAKNNKVPGPCHYNPIEVYKKHSPAWKLSKPNNDKRREQPNSTTPGPGDYDSSASPVRKSQPKFAFGMPEKGKNESIDKRITPGPGQYNAPSFKSSVAFTMGVRNNSQKSITSSESFTTGNDRYLKKSIGVKFGRAKRDYLIAKIQQTPSPGTYSTALEKQLKKVGKRPAFGVSNRYQKSKRETALSPGPASYNPSTLLYKTNTGFSLKGRYKDYDLERKLRLPGPGAYKTDSSTFTHKKSPSCIIPAASLSPTSSKTALPADKTMPSPTSYNPNLNSVKKVPSRFKISNAGRNVMSMDKLNTPGPGEYFYQGGKESKGVGFPKAKRKEILRTSLDPGPGAYSTTVDKTLKNNPSFTMRPRDVSLKRSIDRYKESIPGPGTYETSFHKKTKSIGFGSTSGTKARLKEEFITPGPGHYKIPSRVAEVPPYESDLKPEEFKFT